METRSILSYDGLLQLQLRLCCTDSLSEMERSGLREINRVVGTLVASPDHATVWFYDGSAFVSGQVQHVVLDVSGQTFLNVSGKDVVPEVCFPSRDLAVLAYGYETVKGLAKTDDDLTEVVLNYREQRAKLMDALMAEKCNG